MLLTALLSFAALAYGQDVFQRSQPMIDDLAPSFEASTTMGTLKFPDDYFGKWKILMSHPADFTAVCSSEILEIAQSQDEFDKLNTAVAVISTDGLNSHLEWVNSLESLEYEGRKLKIKFPLIADPNMLIARKYGMVHPNSSSSHAIRSVFFISPENKIRAVISYPMQVGRSVPEMLRVLSALQLTEDHSFLAPANWEPGRDVMLPSPKTVQEAEKLSNKKSADLYNLNWYMWYKKGQ
jgi:peroxiredoxin (alkyl hydroperoxide reductase subunit C)